MEHASYRQFTFTQQPSPIQNENNNAQFTPGSLGMFHPRSRGFPQLPSGSLNTNPTPCSSVGFPFGWNWNSNTLHRQQNVGLAYFGSSSHPLGNNPLLGNIGGTHSLGQKLGGSQAIPTPTKCWFQPILYTIAGEHDGLFPTTFRTSVILVQCPIYGGK